MKQLTGLTALVLFTNFYCACVAVAAMDGFDINLKELRPAPSSPTKSRHRDAHHDAPPARTAATVADGQAGTSLYTVRPGDHLFLILMKRYGLSNDAAEQLIPEVMRLNGIRNPKGLTIGQQLTIPLPIGGDITPKAISKKTPQTATQPDQTTQPSQAPQTADTSLATERRVTVTIAPPCPLAREVLEHLRLIATHNNPLPDMTAFSAGSADLKLVVACDLSPEVAYTYSRLLALRNVSLLVFNGDVPPHRVIEELADHLGFSFYIADPAFPDSLPLTYVFPAEGPHEQDVRLTIGAATENGNSSVR